MTRLIVNQLFEFLKHDFVPGLAGYWLHSLNHGLGARFWAAVRAVTRHKKRGG